MESLARLEAEAPAAIYPAHGPRIDDGVGKIREYIDHRNEREAQIVEALRAGVDRVHDMVRRIYAAYPEALHAAAAQSVLAHLQKLEREARVTGAGDGEPLERSWSLR
jgi:hypothetical protein